MAQCKSKVTRGQCELDDGHVGVHQCDVMQWANAVDVLTKMKEVGDRNMEDLLPKKKSKKKS